jgi:hypothetical protein
MEENLPFTYWPRILWGGVLGPGLFGSWDTGERERPEGWNVCRGCGDPYRHQKPADWNAWLCHLLASSLASFLTALNFCAMEIILVCFATLRG